MSLSLLFGRLSLLPFSLVRPHLSTISAASVSIQRQMSSGSELGRGAGKGGGSGGSIREAGGSLGKAQAAKEEEYFRRLQQEQLGAMQKRMTEEIQHHEREIAHHLEAIKKHKESMEKLGGSDSDDEGHKSSGKGHHGHHKGHHKGDKH